MIKAHPTAAKVNLIGRLSEFRDALQEECDEIEKNGQNSTLLQGGHCIENKGNEFWYRFFVEYMPLLPADTPCKLTIGTDQYDVTVISSTENEIILSTKAKLPANIGKAKLENGSTVLMERLIKCIEDNADKPNPVGDRMFLDKDSHVYQVKHRLTYNDVDYAKHSNERQKNAVKSALENDITYIWGPPGTGKTTVIGNIINELYRHERTVLVVSHTNTAVDGAINKVEKEYKYEKKCKELNIPYPMLRLGIPSSAIPESAQLESHINNLGEALFEKKNKLEERQQIIAAELEEIEEILAKGAWLEKSNLQEIKGIGSLVEKLQKKLLQQEEQVKKAKAELDSLTRLHPEVQSLVLLQEEYQKKCKARVKIQDDIASLKDKEEKCEYDRQHAEDEIKKHGIYEDLTMNLRRYMSVPFYKDKINEIKGEMKSIEETIKSLTEKKDVLQEAITKYESKGAVAKFFSGTTAHEQNLVLLSQTQSNVDSNLDILYQKEKLLADYQKNLDELRVLLEKHRAVAPSRTKRFWTEEEQRFTATKKELGKEKTELEKQEKKLSSQIENIEATKRSNQGFYDSIESLQQSIQACLKNALESKKQLTQNQDILSQLLEKEYELCERFYSIQSQDELDVVKELSILNDRVYDEIHRVDLEEKKQEKESCEAEASEILAELSEIQKKMAELEKQSILSAKIIGTTLAKSYLSDVLRERQFDTVILDEASMASIPALWCAAYLAENNIVIVGDFLQLPPIVMADTAMAKEWLGKDIFDHSGMRELAKKGNRNIRPSNFVMLNEQYRMESQIADIANIYYGEYTKLESYDMNAKRIEDRDRFYKWYSGNQTKAPVHLIDTESLHAWVTGIPQAKSHSRLNSFSAAVDVALAFKCLDKFIEEKLYEKNEDDYKGPKVLIVAPYKPHVTLVNKLIESECQQRGINPDLNLVKAGTIHSFQGSEADIVIFDLVVDEPHYKVGMFMDDQLIDANTKKMFNVAVTRAKFKLFIVGDFKYCKSRAKNNALSVLLKYLIDVKKYRKVDAKEELLPKMFTPHLSHVTLTGKKDAESAFLTESKFNDYFMRDIQTFDHRMIIYSPFMTENRLSLLLPAFASAINRGKQIVVITKPLSERSKSELAKYKKCEEGLRNIGVSILHKKGMHEKIILIDNDVIWNGSLNALSYTGNTGEVMERKKDDSREKTIFNSFVKILDIDYLVKALENDYERKCPLCGGEMLIAEGKDGGIYWRCINKDYNRDKTTPFPVDGVLCCAKCQSPFVFSMKNQPRWQCVADPKHYQIMRKNDLILPKMAALLTKEEIEKVKVFFAKEKRHTVSQSRY